MLDKIIHFSLRNKLIVGLLVLLIIGFGTYSILHIPIGAVPDVTNNQVQVITTSRNLSTADIEQFITTPVELEMANLPGVKEIRSVSKFGLSVVTIVFDDNLGTYLPRQLIAEKIASASENIPEGFGQPFMGPVTTGLGEIYQYILDTKPEYKDKYSIMELRTMQDWLVKRQLSGIPGVVEVNTWGGQLKQYEIAINPQRIQAVDLSITEVFQALENNNSVAGGGYIEKNNQSYFIRGEALLKSTQDIEQVVISNKNGNPILIRDIAEVREGAANRFGAITANGEGEKVMGQIMMLKGANSSSVIKSVKERIDLVQNSLPEGVFINPILERSELIKKTTATVTENLVLGFLIVMFVVVFLLGSWRSGLVVASVIPLCLLFALSLMYIFGVDANLMSLGAIDFGIIIDGAVIIVEYISYKITQKGSYLSHLQGSTLHQAKDKIARQGASKMMNSAVFGQLIIIIVFIPILALTGVEGKMFVPMALAFCFALLGAMFLCFTYVPVVSSLFLKPQEENEKAISNRMMRWLEEKYEITLMFALNAKKWVLGAAVLMLLGAIALFNTMGGEFVPTLDEGDFVIQPVLKTGTSLSKTIEITTQIEKILATFPEVEQTVSRIGAAEVPTDPMSMEESDVIIKLKPKSTWTSAETKDELADAFKEKLSIIPGIDFEFTQPIEMRFNELITGVRADVAIKIFGDDLSILAEKADQIKKRIENVEGAADISLEKVEGLPEMSVKLNRSALAHYGISAKEVNTAIETAFAGKTAGNVYEGEKRFDLVLRNNENTRNEIADLSNTYIHSSNGQNIPINSLAQVRFDKGPAKISRDDTKRRIVIGINVRNRDLESVVNEVRSIIQKDIKLPAGYYITYGGQFENLQNATKRLKIVVPIALFLIFILLYFALGSIKETLLVFTAIPLSAVGGVLFLYLRDLPFSISAGVGFIALFGIAVLNGIVLIEEYKELKQTTDLSTDERVIKGTKQRLRPVLLTAAAAALGFLPMAVSTLAGAEVQRPLATVVIGGLLTATALTLIILPLLYSIFDTLKTKRVSRPIFMLFLLAIGVSANAQTPISTLQQATEIALKNNRTVEISKKNVEQAETYNRYLWKADKTYLYYNFDGNNIAENGEPISVVGASQSAPFPTKISKEKAYNQAVVNASKAYAKLTSFEIEKTVNLAYNQILFSQTLLQKEKYLDSIYNQFAKAAQRRYELGETNKTEALLAYSKSLEQRNKVLIQQTNLQLVYAQMKRILQTNDSIDFSKDEFKQLQYGVNRSGEQSPKLQVLSDNENVISKEVKLAKQALLPDVHLSYFQGSNSAPNSRVYRGVEVGLGIPIFSASQRYDIKATQIQQEISRLEIENYDYELSSRKQQLSAQLLMQADIISSFENTNKVLASTIIQSSQSAFKQGEIDFLTLVQSLEQAKNIEIAHLENINNYNQTVINLTFLN
ncbi:MAG: hypothetical protein RLZZ337_1063 [Bacteroidota bacterium]|jgi:cobalt-zinc-cadmium resistance protein CzcA